MGQDEYSDRKAMIIGSDRSFAKYLEFALKYDWDYGNFRIFSDTEGARDALSDRGGGVSLDDGFTVLLFHGHSGSISARSFGVPDSCPIVREDFFTSMKSASTVDGDLELAVRRHEAVGFRGWLVVGDGCDHKCVSGNEKECFYRSLG